MQALGERKADLVNMEPDGRGRVRLEYRIPARGLIGFQNEFNWLDFDKINSKMIKNSFLVSSGASIKKINDLHRKTSQMKKNYKKPLNFNKVK
jgi:predicted membrane GTPase involved in stress response